MIADRANNVSYTAGMELLVHTVQELSLARSMDQVTAIVRSAARHLTGADGATFVLKDGGNCYYADEDAIEPLWKGHRFPLTSCVSGWAMLHKKAVIIPDIYADERVPVEVYRPTFVKTMVMVPVRQLDPIAAIGNYWAYHHTPSQDQVKLLQSLADITAVTIENIEMYHDLERRVADRTAELRAANADLEAFSYSVSHDLRAPLRTVIGFTDILINENDHSIDGKSLDLLNKVMKNAKNMYQTIEDLISFFTMGQKDLIRTSTSMKAMVQKICDNCTEAEPGREINFKIGELHDIEADEVTMQHVWTNLIQNAVKYSRQKPRAVIEIRSEVKEDKVIYYVKDNGAGFDMTYYHQLFEAFKRLHSGRDFEGSGIGLSIVHKIITRHGGEIWASSEVDKGSTFFFSLPIRPNSSKVALV